MEQASKKALDTIIGGVNVPAQKGKYLEKDLYEKQNIVWMSPNPNRAARRK